MGLTVLSVLGTTAGPVSSVVGFRKAGVVVVVVDVEGGLNENKLVVGAAGVADLESGASNVT